MRFTTGMPNPAQHWCKTLVFGKRPIELCSWNVLLFWTQFLISDSFVFHRQGKWPFGVVLGCTEGLSGFLPFWRRGRVVRLPRAAVPSTHYFHCIVKACDWHRMWISRFIKLWKGRTFLRFLFLRDLYNKEKSFHTQCEYQSGELCK